MKRLSASIIMLGLLAGCSAGGAGPVPTAAQRAGTSAVAQVSAPGGQLQIDAASGGPHISRDLLGASLATWFDITQPAVKTALGNTGLALARWPGGSESDAYHWENGGSVCNGMGYVYPPSTFDNFMTLDVQPNRMDVAITVDYGSNQACNAGGDPAEAAAWAAYAKSKGYKVRYWTVGNEVFGSWEYDLHNPAHDPTTYANAVATGFYPQIKAQDPSAQVGVVVAGSYSPTWDATVLKTAKFDFVEFHYYAQSPGQESDAYLLGKGVTDFSNALKSLRQTMSANGVPTSVPIYVGELNTVYTNPGKQSVSIINGLFAGMAVAEMMKHDVPLSTWWIAFGGCGEGGNMSPSLYGWQNFGTYTLFSDGLPEGGCNNVPPIPEGTDFPSARAYQLLSTYVAPSSHVLSATLSGATGERAYAAKNGSLGYSLLLFNLDKSTTKTMTATMTGQTRTSFTGTQITYGKAQYDDSKNNVWTGPVTTSLGTVSTTFSVTLPPWSMSVVTLR